MTKTAHQHAVALRQCALFARDAGENIALSMIEAADFLDALDAPCTNPLGERQQKVLAAFEKLDATAKIGAIGSTNRHFAKGRQHMAASLLPAISELAEALGVKS